MKIWEQKPFQGKAKVKLENFKFTKEVAMQIIVNQVEGHNLNIFIFTERGTIQAMQKTNKMKVSIRKELQIQEC